MRFTSSSTALTSLLLFLNLTAALPITATSPILNKNPVKRMTVLEGIPLTQSNEPIGGDGNRGIREWNDYPKQPDVDPLTAAVLNTFLGVGDGGIPHDHKYTDIPSYG